MSERAEFDERRIAVIIRRVAGVPVDELPLPQELLGGDVERHRDKDRVHGRPHRDHSR